MESDPDSADGDGLLGGPVVVPLISAKILEKPQVWGIFGDWRDLYAGEGKGIWDAYEKNCFEYCLDVDKEEKWKKMKEGEDDGTNNGETAGTIIGIGLLGDDDEPEIKQGYGLVDAG